MIIQHKESNTHKFLHQGLKQRGGGIFDSITDFVTYIPKKVYQETANFIDPSAKLEFGELHVPQIVNPFSNNGSILKISSFQGPGTNVNRRIDEGIQLGQDGKITGKNAPITQADQISLAHDLRYSLGRNEREADNKMLNKLSLYNPNSWLGYAGIKAKTVLEDIGIAKNGSFASTGFTGTEQQKQKQQNVLNELEKQGYGKKKRKY